jgi:preprotein translocase subunit SecG
MANVLIVAYLLIVLALIGVILLQRSEGGGLGMGSNSNGLMTVRGSANLLTRTTAILAALFFATAIGLTILSELDNQSRGILAGAADDANSTLNAPTTVLDALNALEADGALNVPTAPATTETTPATTETTPDATGADPALAVPSTDPAPAAETAPAAPTAPAATGTAPAGGTTTTPAPADTTSPAATGTEVPAAPAN